MGLHAMLRTVLLGLPAVTALVGAGAAARIRLAHFEKNDGDDARPALLIEVDSADREADLDGASNLIVADVTLICRAATLAAAEELAAAVRAGLAGYSSATLDVVLDAEDFAWSPKADGSTAGWHDVLQSYTLIAGESA